MDLWRNGLFVTPCIKSLYSKMKLTGSRIVCMLSSHYTRYNTCVINKKEGTKTITLNHPITLINTPCMNQRNHHYMAIQFISSYRDGCVNSLSYPTITKILTLIHISNHVDHTTIICGSNNYIDDNAVLTERGLYIAGDSTEPHENYHKQMVVNNTHSRVEMAKQHL